MVEFGARGFSAGSLNVIARDAGIAKGSLFQYFEDKLDMFATICASASDDIAAATQGNLDPDGTYFDSLRLMMSNWLDYFRRHPKERGIAFAAAHEVDAEARAAVRSITNAGFVAALQPMVKQAAARGELRDDADIDELVSMSVLLFRHFDSAPFYEHGDPILPLTKMKAGDVEAVAHSFVGALERAYSA